MFKKYQRIGEIEARPYVRGDQATHDISISEADMQLPTLVGGMVARNPDNHNDMWYIAAAYFAKHYALAASAPETPVAPRGKPCTCDNCLGSSCPCRVEAGERLGDLWYCRKQHEKNRGAGKP